MIKITDHDDPDSASKHELREFSHRYSLDNMLSHRTAYDNNLMESSRLFPQLLKQNPFYIYFNKNIVYLF